MLHCWIFGFNSMQARLHGYREEADGICLIPLGRADQDEHSTAARDLSLG